jgi:hypothetical protein
MAGRFDADAAGTTGDEYALFVEIFHGVFSSVRGVTP